MVVRSPVWKSRRNLRRIDDKANPVSPFVGVNDQIAILGMDFDMIRVRDEVSFAGRKSDFHREKLGLQ